MEINAIVQRVEVDGLYGRLILKQRDGQLPSIKGEWVLETTPEVAIKVAQNLQKHAVQDVKIEIRMVPDV